MTIRLVLGNRDAVHSRDSGETRERLPKGKRATVVEFPDDTSLLEAFKTVVDPQGVWQAHVDNPERTPAWVAVDDEHPMLAQMLSEHFGGVEIRKMLDPYDPETKRAPTKVVKATLGLMLSVVLMLAMLQRLMLLLKTNVGNDFQATQMGGSASATAVAKFVGLTANVTAPAAGDTTLTAEITTGGGGLIRKAGTYAHTTSAASYTITTVFTVNGSDSIPVTIGKRGIFDAVTAGQLVFEALVSPTATLSAVGDTLTLTDTISL
jgi:hypothetical protein